MQTLGAFLILLNVVTIVGPIAGMAIVYQNNLAELVFPPEVENIVSNITNTGRPIELPQFVNSTYNESSRTVSALFRFTNPFDLDLTINSMSVDVECTAHNFTLGHAALSNPVQLSAGETAIIIIVFTWTQVAENHFQTEHPGATSISVDLVNIVIDVSGISVEIPQRVSIPNIQIIQ